MSHPLVLKLQQRDDLSEQECALLEQAPVETRTFGEGEMLVRDGQTLDFSSLLIEGWTGRIKTRPNGERAITALNLTGDFVDLQSLLLTPMDHSIVALTKVKAAIVPHAALRRITEEHPHLSRMLWLNTLVDAAIHREWLAAMARGGAVSQLARLFCELYLRLEVVNQAEGFSFRFPLTQLDIADAVGLSPVHVNRTLQDLRKRDLLTWRRSVVTLLDWDGLAAVGQFDPAYLNLTKASR